jgi:hypothetical protein
MRFFSYLLTLSIFSIEAAPAVRITVLNDCIKSIVEKDERYRSRPRQPQVLDEKTSGSLRIKIEGVKNEIETLEALILKERNGKWKRFLREMLNAKKRTLDGLVPKKRNELFENFLKVMNN